VELHGRSEGDSNFFGLPLAEYIARHYTLGQATGKLKSLSFVDLDALHWRAATQTAASQGAAARAPSVAHLAALADRRYLLVVAERAVVLLDVLSRRVRRARRDRGFGANGRGLRAEAESWG